MVPKTSIFFKIWQHCIFKLSSLQIIEVLRILEIVCNDDDMSPSTILHIVESNVCKSVKKVPFGKFGIFCKIQIFKATPS